MLKSIFHPTRQNAFIWLNCLYLLLLLYLDKVTPIIILFAYFIETLVIGVFNALKMLWSILYGKSKNNSIGLVFFFLFHYGFFVAIQSIFGFALFSIESKKIIQKPFHVLENYAAIIQLENIQYALIAIIFTHLGKFITDYIQQKKYEKFTASEIMFKPYVRIFIQQFVVILAIFFIVFSNAGVIAAVLLILIRFSIDLVLESIKENSASLDYLAEKLQNDKASKAEIKKQLIFFTE